MADGITAGVISDSLDKNIGDLNNSIKESQTKSTESLAKTIEGVTERLNEELEVAVNSLPDQFKEVYAALATVSKSIISVQKITEKNEKKQEAEAAGDTKKKGKKDFTINDVSKLPAHISSAPLYLGKILNDFIKSYTKNVAETKKSFFKKDKKDDKNKLVKGPQLDFSGTGWGALANTMLKYAQTSKEMNIGKLKAAKKSVWALGDFMDESKKMIEEKGTIDKTKITGFNLLIKGINNALEAIKKMILFAILMTPLVLLANLGLKTLKNFLKDTVEIAKDPEPNLTWQQLGKNMMIIKAFASNFNAAAAYLLISMIILGVIAAVYLPARLGIFVLSKFLTAVVEVTKNPKGSTWETMSKHAVIMRTFAVNFAGALFPLLLSMIILCMMVVVGLVAHLGILVLRLFILHAAEVTKNPKGTTWETMTKHATLMKNFGVAFNAALVPLLFSMILLMMIAIVGLISIVGLLVISLWFKVLPLVLKAAKNINVKDLTLFNTIATTLQVGIIAIAISMLCASLVLTIALPALLGLLFIVAFMTLVTLVGVLAGWALPFIAVFTLAAALIAIALILFAVTMILINNTMLTPKIFMKLFIMLGSLALILISFAILGVFSLFLLIFIAPLIAAAILLFVAMACLWLVFKILNNFPDLEGVAAQMMQIGLFFMCLSLFVLFFLVGAIASIFLLVASLLLFLGLFFLWIALMMMDFVINKIVKLMSMEVGDDAPKGFWGALGLLALFFVGVILLTPLLVLVLIPAALLIVVSVLLFASFLLLTLTIALITGLAAMIKENWTDIQSALINLQQFFMLLLPLGAISLLVVVLAVPILAAAALLLTAFVLLTGVIALVLAISKINVTKELAEKVQGRLIAIFDIVGVKLMLRALKVVTVAAPVLAASTMMLLIFSAIAGIYAAIDKIAAVQDKVDPQPIFKAVDQLMDMVVQVSKNMKDSSAAAMANFRIGLGGIIEAVKGLTDIILKLADPNIVNDIPDAVKNLQLIIEKMFGFDEKGNISTEGFTIMNIFKTIGDGISKNQKRAIEALVPLTEAIKNITDTIQLIKDIDDIDVGIINVGKITELMKDIDSFIGNMNSSNKQVKQAVEKIKNIEPLIDNLIIISKKSLDLESADDANIQLLITFCNSLDGLITGMTSKNKQVTEAAKKIKDIIPLIDDLIIISKKSLDLEDMSISNTNMIGLIKFGKSLDDFMKSISLDNKKVKQAAEKVRDMLPMVADLVKMSKSGNEFQEIAINLEKCIVDPLIKLSEPTNNLERVTREVKNLNSELNKLAKDNKDTLKYIGQIGNASGSNISSLIGKISGFFSKGKGAGEIVGDNMTEDPMEQIAKDVRAIAEKLIEGSAKSWAAEA